MSENSQSQPQEEQPAINDFAYQCQYEQGNLNGNYLLFELYTRFLKK